MHTRAFLIETHDFDGPMNMALDEVLWTESANGSAFVRLYEWADRPALSIGFFQDARAVRSLERLARLPCVRRLTGGGAIVHEHEVTYSLALPTRLSGSTTQLYQRFHDAVRRAIGECLGGPIADEPSAVRGAGAAADLCFHRMDQFAVRVGGAKVLGSAQRRRPSHVLMHGSLLLARSDAAPSLPGLWDVTAVPRSVSHARELLRRAAAAAIPAELVPIPIPDAILQTARALADSKYRDPAWNERVARRWT